MLVHPSTLKETKIRALHFIARGSVCHLFFGFLLLEGFVLHSKRLTVSSNKCERYTYIQATRTLFITLLHNNNNERVNGKHVDVEAKATAAFEQSMDVGVKREQTVERITSREQDVDVAQAARIFRYSPSPRFSFFPPPLQQLCE